MKRPANILGKTLPLVLLFYALFCNKRVNNETGTPERISIPAFGSQNTFEIASWNIEQFPKSNQTVSDVAEIIRDLDIDLFAVQEIGSQNAFNTVASQLPDYDGFLANFSGSLRTGIFYRSSLISIVSDTLLFQSDTYNFPRPPLMLFLKAQQGTQSFDFYLIVIHLKAYEDSESENRRRVAIREMEQFIGNRIQQGGDPDYIIAGDWNDELEDDSTHNVFNPFLNNPMQYVFLTLPFAGSPTEYSYIGGNFKSLIDHIMVTVSVSTSYNINTRIIKIDQVFNQYETEVSDHRPVAASIPAF
jgi:endonuclease/exonuclease/phosphatase family metal-dependent hydrolase